MSNCPYCGQQLVPDQNNPSKVLCYNCRKRFDAATVAAQQQAQPQYQQPQQYNDPYAQPPGPGPQQPPYGGQPPYGQPVPGMPPGPGGPGMSPYDQQQYDQQPIYGEQQASLPKGKAVAALIFGIIALIISWFPVFGLIIALIALILGISTIRGANRQKNGGKGMGVAGVILGILSMIGNVLMCVLVYLILSTGNYSTIFNGTSYDSLDDAIGAITAIINSDGTSTTSGSTSSSGSAASSTTADGTNWVGASITLDGVEFTLGECTVKDLEKAGWKLDLDAYGYPDGYDVDSYELMSNVSLTNEDNSRDMVTINAFNATEDTLDIMECMVSKISFSSYNGDGKIEFCGITTGDDLADVQAAFGEPTDSYEGTSGYTEYTYNSSDDNYRIRFTSDDGKTVDEIEYTTYKYV